ncbi:hypothetical protein STEG23_011211, partial [Scotinomys teguina]
MAIGLYEVRVSAETGETTDLFCRIQVGSRLCSRLRLQREKNVGVGNLGSSLTPPIPDPAPQKARQVSVPPRRLLKTTPTGNLRLVTRPARAPLCGHSPVSIMSVEDMPGHVWELIGIADRVPCLPHLYGQMVVLHHLKLSERAVVI